MYSDVMYSDVRRQLRYKWVDILISLKTKTAINNPAGLSGVLLCTFVLTRARLVLW